MNCDEQNALILDACSRVPAKVDRFLRLNQDYAFLRDDLVGECNLKIVEAVAKLVAGTIKKPSTPLAYLAQVVTTAIRDKAEDSHIFGPSSATRRRHRREGTESPEFKQAHPDTLDDYSRDSGGGNQQELREQINALCETELESQVVDLRAQGLVDAEISERLKVSPSSVYRSRKRVEARFDEVCHELGA